MAYTAPTSKALRTRKGRIDEKIATELGLIDAEMAAIQGGTLTIANTKIMVGNAQGVGAAVNVSGDATLANTGEITIAAEAVTLAKMADLATGSLIVGAAANRPTALDAKTAGQTLVGDGTDRAAVAVSGDATLAATGEITIAAGAVTGAKIAASFGKLAEVELVPGVANAIAAAWQNPEAVPIVVEKVYVRLTAGGGTVGATMDVGSAPDGLTGAANLITGLDITSPTLKPTDCGMVCVLDAAGGTTDWVTFQILDANAESLAGSAYIRYFTV